MRDRQPTPGLHESFSNLIKIKPGDRFVMRLDGKASLEMVARIQATWRDFAGGESKLLVLDKGTDLTILRQPDTPPPEHHLVGAEPAAWGHYAADRKTLLNVFYAEPESYTAYPGEVIVPLRPDFSGVASPSPQSNVRPNDEPVAWYMHLWNAADEDVKSGVRWGQPTGDEIQWAEHNGHDIEHLYARPAPVSHVMGLDPATVEACARLIDENIIKDTSAGKVLAPRQDGNRDGLHYATALRALTTTEGQP